MQLELHCTGDHDPAWQRKKGGTATPSQRAKLDVSVSFSAKGRLVEAGLKEHHCRSKEVQEDAVEIDDRAHFTVDDIREAIAASGAC